MQRLFTFCCLLVLGLALSHCEPSPEATPSDCGYDSPLLTFSAPDDCTPLLTRFDKLDQLVAGQAGANPPRLPAGCTSKGVYQIAELPATTSGAFVLHVYNGTAHELYVEVFGTTGCNDFAAIGECSTVSAITTRIPVEAPTYYDRYFVRFAIGQPQVDAPLGGDDFVALAAYDEGEPVGTGGGISYNFPKGGDHGVPLTNDDLTGRLTYSCNGTSFQRLALSGCGMDADVLRYWAELTGLPVSEQYYGPKGNVVMLDVPPGMDLNTGGDGARTLKAKINTGDGIVEQDYVINLFTPEEPTRADGSVTTVENDPVIKRRDLSYTYFQQLLPPFDPPMKYDGGKRPLTVSIIDSGTDDSGPGTPYWGAHRYQKGPTTEYVKPGTLGPDFIAKDLTPNDETPHGTLVAGALLGAYAADNPLQLVHFKTFGEKGQSSYFGALVSIYEAIAIGSDVINMSWGITQDKAPEALECAIDRAVSDGVYLVTSAGNDSASLAKSPQWPANFSDRYPERLLTVGSYWYDGKGLDNTGRPDPARDPAQVLLRNFSNYGDPLVSVAAYMTAPVPAYQQTGTVLPVGTSFSAPQIAGRLAGLVDRYPGSAIAALQNDFSAATTLAKLIYKDYYLPTPDRGGTLP